MLSFDKKTRVSETNYYHFLNVFLCVFLHFGDLKQCWVAISNFLIVFDQFVTPLSYFGYFGVLRIGFGAFVSCDFVREQGKQMSQCLCSSDSAYLAFIQQQSVEHYEIP